MRIGILGAGAAGLSCGWLLQQKGLDVTIFEQQAYAGGLARSFKWHGVDCDFAAHRLFTRNEAVLEKLCAMTPMLQHNRSSQIYFNHAWMSDPLDVIELAKRTSIPQIGAILWSYLRRPRSVQPDSFQTFVIQRYGSELYDYFFRPYTEKLFGIPGSDIALSWAQTKVRLAGPFDRFKRSTKTKFNHFYYPERGGYGAVVDHMYDALQNQVKLNSKVTGLASIADQITAVHYEQDGQQYEAPVDLLISTLPLTVTAKMLGYDLKLSYRSVHAVYLLLNKAQLSKNHWIYFMDDDIIINRLVEFKNMSPVDKPGDTTIVCAEVTKIDENLPQRVIDDLVKAGLINQSDVLDTRVLTERFAYPIYDKTYESKVVGAQSHFGQFNNLYTVGRAAEFKHRELDDNFESAVDATNQILGVIRQAASGTLQTPAEQSISKQATEFLAEENMRRNSFADAEFSQTSLTSI